MEWLSARPPLQVSRERLFRARRSHVSLATPAKRQQPHTAARLLPLSSRIRSGSTCNLQVVSPSIVLYASETDNHVQASRRELTDERNRQCVFIDYLRTLDRRSTSFGIGELFVDSSHLAYQLKITAQLRRTRHKGKRFTMTAMESEQ